MDIFQDDPYRITWFFMTSVGQWPYQNSKKRLLPRIFVCTIILSFLIVQLLKIFTTNFDEDTLITVLPPLFSSMTCFTKYFNCWFKSDAMKYLLEHIKRDWRMLKVKEEQEILYKYAERGKLYGLYYAILIYLCIFLFMAMPFAPKIMDIITPLNESRSYFLPLEAEYFVDTEKYFYLILGHINVSVLIVLTVLVASDVIFITFLLHACGLFSVLGYKLHHVFDNTDNYQKIYSNIIHCVKYHRSVLRYAEMIESCYAFSYVIQLFFTVIIFIVLLLHLCEAVTVLNNFGDTAICLIYIVGHSLVVFLNVIPGQKLLDYSNSVFHEAYCGYWYMAPSNTQRLLLLIMQRSRKPSNLTGAYILTISFEMYVTILQTSLSYFTVLYSIR